MKDLPFAKPTFITIPKAKKKANTAFSRYIRTRDARGNDFLLCITCGKAYPAFGRGCAQAGHFLPGRHSSVVYDERNAHGQCYNCNVTLKGNWRKYEDKMREMYGQEVIDELKRLDRIDMHYKAQDYLDIEKDFIERLKKL